MVNMIPGSNPDETQEPSRLIPTTMDVGRQDQNVLGALGTECMYVWCSSYIVLICVNSDALSERNEYFHGNELFQIRH